MISSFANQMIEDIFHGNPSHRVREQVPPFVVKEVERKLDLLNALDTIETLRELPLYRSGVLGHNAQGKYKIPLGNNWFLAFRLNNEAVFDVELTT